MLHEDRQGWKKNNPTDAVPLMKSEKRPTNSQSSSYRILIRPHPNLGFLYLPDPVPPTFSICRNQCAVSLLAHPFLPVFFCSEKGKREKCTCAMVLRPSSSSSSLGGSSQNRLAESRLRLSQKSASGVRFLIQTLGGKGNFLFLGRSSAFL